MVGEKSSEKPWPLLQSPDVIPEQRADISAPDLIGVASQRDALERIGIVLPQSGQA